MEKNYRLPFKIVEDSHLRNILDHDLFLELGIIDVSVIRRLLTFEVIDIDEVTFFPIQNKGLGHGLNKDEVLKNNIPFYFYRKLMEGNPLLQLTISYGLYCYRDFGKMDKFAPIILIPITMFYENDKTYIKMISRPFENPILYSIIKNQQRIQFLQNETYEDIYSLDRVIHNLNKLFPNSVRIDNYLTFIELKKSEIIISNKKSVDALFNEAHKPNEDRVYLSRMINKTQKNAVNRAISGESITLTGFSGTGKTTALENIVVNLISQKKRVLYITDSYETINEVHSFMNDIGLGKLVLNLCNITKTNNDNETNSSKDKKYDIASLRNKLIDRTLFIKEYEKNMNISVADFKFVDIIKRFFLIDSFDEIKDLHFPMGDDLEYLYKHEYKLIYDSLCVIEENYQKIGSFKNSVWNQIPYLNSIKYNSQVINIVNQLNNGFISLREYELKLESYGVKLITSFSAMKRCLLSISKLDRKHYPSKWIDNLNVFFDAKKKYADLENDIYEYRKDVDNINTHYINLKSINIENEINCLYDKFFTKGEEEKIEKIISYREDLNGIAISTLDEISRLTSTIKELSSILDWEFTTKDEQIEDFNNLANMYINYPICGKMLAFFINKKSEMFKQRVSALYNSITTIHSQIDEYNASIKNRKMFKSLRQKDILDAESISNLNKKVSKLEKEYHDLTEDNYQNHKLVWEGIELLESFYEDLKVKNYRKKLYDFILTFTKNNRNNIQPLLQRYLDSLNDLDKRCESFSKFAFVYDNLSIMDRYAHLQRFCEYIEGVHASQIRVKAVILNNPNDEIHVNEYLLIKSTLDNNSKIVTGLRSNAMYKKLFGFLYTGEETSLAVVNQAIQIFDTYINTFEDNKKAISSFGKLEEIKKLVEEISNLVSSIGEVLNLYSKIFKDGTSRYYFSSIEKNINTLSELLNAQEELNYYLNITQAYSILDLYNLKNLISYILNTEDTYKLGSRFSYIYFKNIIDRTFDKVNLLKDSVKYFINLDEILEYEDILCNQISNNVINLILASNNRNSSFTHNHTNVIPRIRANLVLSTTKYAIEFLSKKQFDTLIIDDAHIIVSGQMIDMFKGKQLIVSGDYQSNKVVNQNLISILTNSQTITFRKRLVLGPRKLTYNLPLTSSPYQNKLNKNYGIRVINRNFEDCIYDIYKSNENVKINIFVRYTESQRTVYENLAKAFLQKGISRENVISFLNKNTNIVDLDVNNYVHSDYNVLVFNEYYQENSQIVSSNNLEVLMLPSQELIIYDENDYLNKPNIDFCFFNMIKKLVTDKKIFLKEDNDDISSLIANNLIKKGYEVCYPGNGVNLAVLKKGTDELVSIIILFSNGFVYDIVSNYRDLTMIYRNNGHKIIIKSMIDLVQGPQKFIDSLCEEIDG